MTLTSCCYLMLLLLLPAAGMVLSRAKARCVRRLRSASTPACAPQTRCL
jgi:hypothetical protein